MSVMQPCLNLAPNRGNDAFCSDFIMIPLRVVYDSRGTDFVYVTTTASPCEPVSEESVPFA